MTAIREIDLAGTDWALDDVPGYDRCMIVVRWRRRVVGRIFVPVTAGRIDRKAVERAIAAGPGQEAVSRWIDETLAVPAPAGPEPGLATVAICTRDRPDDVQRALRAVVALHPGPGDVLVVDNAPRTDATRLAVQQFPSVRYVLEGRAGLNAARNRALREARGEIVAFTDDDAVPEPEWLQGLLRGFARPRVVCSTGLTLPLELDTPAQEQFEDYTTFVRGFSRRVFDGCSMDPLAVGAVGAGANMAVRREVVLALGGFDERLDAGTPTRSGGDHEMFTRILAAGYQIAYEPDAVSWHRHRRTDRELTEAVHGYGVGVYAMWTGLLYERGEHGVFRLAWLWLRQGQLPALFGRHPAGQHMARLARAELRGCLRGPAAWFASRRLLQKERAC